MPAEVSNDMALGPVAPSLEGRFMLVAERSQVRGQAGARWYSVPQRRRTLLGPAHAFSPGLVAMSGGPEGVCVCALRKQKAAGVRTAWHWMQRRGLLHLL